MAGESTNVVEVFLVRDVLGASALTFGALGAAFAVGAAVGSVLGGRLHDIRRQIDGVLLACGLVSCTLLAGGLVTLLPLWAAVWVTTGVAVGALQTICGSVLGVRAPEQARGQVFATIAAATRAASLVATALGGLVGAVLGAQSVFVVAGVGCLVATLGALPSLRRSARVTRRPDQSQAEEGRVTQVA
jgi:MFS family permease